MPVPSIGVEKIAQMLRVWPVLVNALAFLALLCALVLDGAIAAPLLALLPLAVIGWRQRRVIFRAPSRAGGTDRYPTARYLLLAAATAHLHALDRLGALALAAILLLALAMALEPVVGALRRLSVPFASGMPGTSERRGPTPPHGVAFPLSLLAILLMVLAGFAPTPLLVIVLLLAVAIVGVLSTAVLRIARDIQDRRRFQADLPRILEEMAPVFYVYWHAPPKSAFQVTM